MTETRIVKMKRLLRRTFHVPQVFGPIEYWEIIG